MLFQSGEYAVLLAVTFLAYFGMAGFRTPRLLILLGASCVFYGFWNPAYLILIFICSALAHLVGLAIHRSASRRRQKLFLALGATLSLSVLATFKYGDFVLSSFRAAAGAAGWPLPPLALRLIAPVGISFFTFELLSYLVDVYRGRIEPARSPLELLIFIAFFPHLVAGPIMRAHDFLPQLRPVPSLSAGDGGRAVFLLCVGLLKKAVIADLLALNLVDRVFETPARYTSAEILVGIYGYALQIYCDFSAYSDLAIGSALLLGLRLPQNFDRPYLSRSVTEFWRRWHISLSSWLRDYLFLSLGGAGGSRWRAARNLMITMLLGGLWHGAAWTFVAWGALHGLGLAFGAAWGSRDRGAAARSGARLLRDALCALLTFHFVCLGWVLFRAASFQGAWEMLQEVAALRGGTANVTPLLWAVLAAGALTHLVPRRVVAGAEAVVTSMPAAAQGALLLATVLAARWAGTTGVVPFIYFQF